MFRYCWCITLGSPSLLQPDSIIINNCTNHRTHNDINVFYRYLADSVKDKANSVKKTAAELQSTVDDIKEGKVDTSVVLKGAGDLFERATTKENVRSFVSLFVDSLEAALVLTAESTVELIRATPRIVQVSLTLNVSTVGILCTLECCIR